MQKPASFHPWQSEEGERSLQLPNSKRKHVYENLSEGAAVIARRWNKFCMFWSIIMCYSSSHGTRSACLSFLLCYSTFYVTVTLHLPRPRGQTVPGIRPYIYMGYIGMYRPIGYGFEGLDKNRLTLFDLVSVVYPV